MPPKKKSSLPKKGKTLKEDANSDSSKKTVSSKKSTKSKKNSLTSKKSTNSGLGSTTSLKDKKVAKESAKSLNKIDASTQEDKEHPRTTYICFCNPGDLPEGAYCCGGNIYNKYHGFDPYEMLRNLFCNEDGEEDESDSDEADHGNFYNNYNMNWRNMNKPKASINAAEVFPKFVCPCDSSEEDSYDSDIDGYDTFYNNYNRNWRYKAPSSHPWLWNTSNHQTTYRDAYRYYKPRNTQ